MEKLYLQLCSNDWFIRELISFFFHIHWHWFMAITFLILILANCFRDESCRENLAPTSPNGSGQNDTWGKMKQRDFSNDNVSYSN